ncbi:MAG: dUTP diphosphatase [Bacteroidota bacterium]
MQVKIINRSQNELPAHATPGASGLDLKAHIPKPTILQPLQRTLVATGLHIALPKGFEAQIRPRSGLAHRHGITVLNSPGTIDPDYRGEIQILLINLGDQPFEINNGDRVAQLVISRVERIQWMYVNALDDTLRGQGGFGSTGI